jgi:hypothetical protein
MNSLFESIASMNTTGPPPPEGSLDASLGAVSAFFGTIAILFAIPAVVGTASALVVLRLALTATGFAALGILAGRRAPRVTTRNLILAKSGYALSVVALAGSIVALSVAMARELI